MNSRTENIVVNEDDKYFYGVRNRYDSKDFLESKVDWVIWKGNTVSSEVKDESQKDFAREVAKLMTNDGFALAKEFGDVSLHYLIPSEVFYFLCREFFITKNLEKKYFKDIVTRWLYGEASILEIVADKKYVKADESIVDIAVQEVYNENTNAYDGSDKILNWLVGQVMKKTKGKADASKLKEKIIEIYTS